MGASNTIKLLERAGIKAERTSEPVMVLPETLRKAVDPEDDLFCPGVDDEPSESLIVSMRNGWADGSTILCVNRGPKGGEPIPYIVAGRSRQKAAILVNKERAAAGLPPIKAAIIFVDPAEAYRLMLIENNKQKRRPLFDARRWEHHKRVAAKRLGKTTLSESERAEARAEFAEMVGRSESIINRWEAILSAHPSLIAAVEAGDVSQNDAYKLVQTYSHDDQAKVVARMAAPAKPSDEAQPSDKPDPKPRERGPKMRPAKMVAGLLAEFRKEQEDVVGPTGEPWVMVDPVAFLAWLTGDDTALDGDDPGIAEVRRLAARAGWKKVAK